jgi:hypothetical protein
LEAQKVACWLLLLQHARPVWVKLMNLKRGLLRLWLALTVLWYVLMAVSGYDTWVSYQRTHSPEYQQRMARKDVFETRAWIEVKLPDGRTVDVDTNDPEIAQNAAKKFLDNNPVAAARKGRWDDQSVPIVRDPWEAAPSGAEVARSEFDNILLVASLPPLATLAFGFVVGWIVRGFRRNA